MSAAVQRKVVAGTSAVAGSLAPAGSPRRTPLSVVRSLPARRRAPFAIFCLGVLAAALITVLVLNIAVSTGQYQLVQLKSQQLDLEKQNQDLAQRVQNFQAPQNLAAQAAQLGMVASTTKGQIDLKTLMVTGKPKPADKGAAMGSAIAAPEVPGLVAAGPAASPASGGSDALKQDASKQPANSPAQQAPAASAPATVKTPAPQLNGGTVPAPQQKTPGQ